MNEFIHKLEENCMKEILNIFFAWLVSICVLGLSIIYPLRLYCQKKKLNTNSFICRINRFFRRIHKSLGIAVIFITLLHCRFSSQHFGLNTGTICFWILLLILCTYLFRKNLKRKWILLHRELTALLWLLIILHTIFTRYFNI